VNPEALDADCSALAAAGSVAEEALALHCEALAILEQGWHSQSGSAATDVLRRQCGEAAELVTALHDATGDFRALRDAAEYGVDASTAQPSNRLSDRPPAQFETAEPFLFGSAAAPAPAPPPVPPPAPAWTPGTAEPPLPDLGGALVGLVAQIADAVSSLSAEEGAGLEAAQPTDPPADPPAESSAAPPKPESPAVPPVSPPVQFVGPSAPPESPPPPLLAAERPPDPPPEPGPASPPVPEVAAAPPESPPESPPEDPRTPCEIAADALPQVGQ
jgi:hypothetical protein